MGHARLASVVIFVALTVACSRRAPHATADGRSLFASTCARCHGADGTGGLAHDGAPAPRNFHDAAFQSSRTDDQLIDAITRGKSSAMPSFATTFDDGQIRALVGVVRSFDPRKGAP
jgi:high-affinity iron transporter